MAYLQQYQIDITKINTDIDSGLINGTGEALDKFRTYIGQVKNIGRYSIANWPSNFIQNIYDFGKKFSSIDPTEFLTAIENEIINSSFEEKEILYFFKSEILWNFESHLKQESFLEDLLERYVTNAEFLHTLGHIKMKKKKYVEAIELYTQAYRINPSDVFLSTKFSNEIHYIEDLIENENYDEAENLINERIESNVYKNNFIRQNWFVFLRNRIKDYKLLEIKALKKDNELKKILDIEFQSERRKVIELLGLFTAIIAFIFTTVSVAKTFDFYQAINFITCLGLVLIAFSISISLIFQQSTKPIYKDVRLYGLLIIAITLFVILSSSTLVNSCYDRLNFNCF